MSARASPGNFNPLLDLVRFWARPIRAEPLALFRILMGANLLACMLLTYVPDLNHFLGKDGLCPPGPLEDFFNRGRFCLLLGPTSIPLLDGWPPNAKEKSWEGPFSAEQKKSWAAWGDDLRNVYLVLGVYLAALVFMTLGLFTRPAIILAWVLGTTLFHRLSDTTNGGESMARMALFYLMFAPAGAVWSLDSLWRRRRGRQPGDSQPVLIPAWSVRLPQIQLCLVYLFTGLVKLGEDFFTDNWYNCDWLNGEAVYGALNDVAITRYPYWWTPIPLWGCRLLSWGTMVFELGFSFFVLFREFRPYLLLVGVALHLGILVHMELAWFSPFALCWYVLFIPGESLQRFFRVVGNLWPFGRRAAKD